MQALMVVFILAIVAALFLAWSAQADHLKKAMKSAESKGTAASSAPVAKPKSTE